MISLLKGKIFKSTVLTQSGVGYKVYTVDKFKDNDDVSLHISTVVRENSIMLFGFKNDIDLQFFENLNKINGVGPQTALLILRELTLDEIFYAIEKNDKNAFSKVKGLGPKGSQRLISDFVIPKEFNPGVNSNSNVRGDIVDLLVNLGYEEKIVKDILNVIKSESESDIVSEALSLLRSKA
jgi:Holliday junction DNA helicase RuvA